MSKFNPGGQLQQTYDVRDFPYEAFIGSGFDDIPDFYDVEDDYGVITQKDQKDTQACGGMAVAYYAEALQRVESGSLYEFSPRSIYAFTHLSGGGSITRENILRLIGFGISPEMLYSSQPMTEDHVSDSSGWTTDIAKTALIYKGKIATTILDRTNFDLFRTAIYQNHGVVSGVNLSYAGWHSNPIRPPKEGEKIAGHILYFKGYGKDQFGDYILVKDSYPSGDKKIYRDYFNASMVHSAWVAVDAPNNDWIMEKFYPQANDLLNKFTGKPDNNPDADSLAKAWRVGDGNASKAIIDKYRLQYPLGNSNADQKLAQVKQIVNS